MPHNLGPIVHEATADIWAPALRLAQQDAGYTNEELAEACGVTLSTVKRWRAGRNSPTVRQLLMAPEVYVAYQRRVLPLLLEAA